MAKNPTLLGLDIGGTGIKAALVDYHKGTLASERLRVETAQPATPEAMIAQIKRLVRDLDYAGPIGCGFPGVIKHGCVYRAPNLDSSWIDFPIIDELARELGTSAVAVGNDADAAGVAEIAYGAGMNASGNVMMVTLGTGIGTALFCDGQLVKNTELGHLEIRGKDSERRASNSARERHEWSWKKWGGFVDEYLSNLEYLLGVDMFIIGGGISKKWEKFSPYFKKVSCHVAPATMGNLAGIVGAAMLAKPFVNGSAKAVRAHT